jgi:hypothetical protein
MALARPPFCATSRAVGLDVAAVDLARFRDPAFLRQRRQDARPDAPAATGSIDYRPSLKGRIRKGNPPHGHRT